MKPNVIIINCDDLGYGDIGPYGNEINHTPFLDKISKLGTKFTSAYSASSICTPSRAGLMTGCYPARVSTCRVLFPCEKYGLNSSEYTMPKLFSENGYKTKIIGKWHLGDQQDFMPEHFGFDDYYGIPYSNDMGRQLMAKGSVTPYPPLPLIRGTSIIQEQPDQCSITERYTEEAVQFLRENKDENFFLYLAHMHVHLPLYAAERFTKESENGDFGACVAEMDWSCGVVMDELKALGIEENTLVIFTSDNGSTCKLGASNKPLKGSKFSTWEGGFRVPFFAIWKNHIEENTVCDEIISHIDLLPTFAKILDSKLSDNLIDGVDISKTLFKKEVARDIFVYFVLADNEKLGIQSIAAVRKGNYKLHFLRQDTHISEFYETKELYDVQNDLGEDNNIYEQNPEIVAEITKIYNEYQEKLGNFYYGVKGKEVRPCAEVENPVPLTNYDPNHPYIVALYDKHQRG